MNTDKLILQLLDFDCMSFFPEIKLFVELIFILSKCIRFFFDKSVFIC